ncbi:hypothetical protein HPB47_016706 [Ixodes persulcatus]|uniref:Uncharacterized protein n=1 Tax=Ixodes persulcatus TaxID=34615 RepID=A0AC60QRE8_IXOPE|nr:hypothetical protein HPB47_016706 [Ixodes persulcatus]
MVVLSNSMIVMAVCMIALRCLGSCGASSSQDVTINYRLLFHTYTVSSWIVFGAVAAGAVVVLTSDFNIDGGVDDMSAFAENYRTILNDFLAENMIKAAEITFGDLKNRLEFHQYVFGAALHFFTESTGRRPPTPVFADSMASLDHPEAPVNVPQPEDVDLQATETSAGQPGSLSLTGNTAAAPAAAVAAPPSIIIRPQTNPFAPLMDLEHAQHEERKLLNLSSNLVTLHQIQTGTILTPYLLQRFRQHSSSHREKGSGAATTNLPGGHVDAAAFSIEVEDLFYSVLHEGVFVPVRECIEENGVIRSLFIKLFVIFVVISMCGMMGGFVLGYLNYDNSKSPLERNVLSNLAGYLLVM